VARSHHSTALRTAPPGAAWRSETILFEARASISYNAKFVY